MVIGHRLKELRESKKLSQGDIEKRTGLLRWLHFPGREWPYGSSRRNVGEAGTSFRGPHVAAFS
jgi:transcriptional regulator with XRE-family HTH domain